MTVCYLWVIIFFHRGFDTENFITNPYCGDETVHNDIFIETIFPLTLIIFFLNPSLTIKIFLVNFIVLL